MLASYVLIFDDEYINIETVKSFTINHSNYTLILAYYYADRATIRACTPQEWSSLISQFNKINTRYLYNTLEY